MNSPHPQRELHLFAWSARARVYHGRQCRWAWRIRAANRRGGTRGEAAQAGRRECRACVRERAA
jgi:hypothetical protein